MEFAELPEFSKDLKRLKKKYRSLDEDLKRLRDVLVQLPKGNGSKHWNRLHEREGLCIYKVRLACIYLRETTMRVIYAYRIEKNTIDFIELYYKGEREMEDKQRLENYLKTL